MAWYQESQVLSDEDEALIENLRDLRQQAVHEGIDLLLGLDRAFDEQVLVDGVELLRRIGTFWAEIDMDTNPAFDHSDVDPAEVQPMDVLMSEHIWNAAQAMIEAGRLADETYSREQA